MHNPIAVDNKSSPKYWRLLKITGKVSEAKHLDTKNDKEAFYCVSRIDNQSANEFVTQSIPSNESLFWAEDFCFETRIGFKELKFGVHSQEKTKWGTVDRSIGKVVMINQVVIPRKYIKSGEEQWYMLTDTNYDIRGKNQLNSIWIDQYPHKVDLTNQTFPTKSTT